MNSPSRRPPASLPACNLARAVELVERFMAIPGVSGQEGEVAAAIRELLLRAGAAPQQIAMDAAGKKTPLRSHVGNLIFKLPGRGPRQPRRMFSAHMDTVPICLGSRPRRQGGLFRAADPHTGLGADDRAGVVVVLNTALHALEHQGPRPPLTFCWFVQEEIGLQGARVVSPKSLGSPATAFNWDGGSPAKVTIGATGGYRLEITVRGVASHAGNSPERGVSAIAIAALAIADLQQHGWHGLIEKEGRRGTSNVGVVQGGNATNVVADRVELRVEARSHDPRFRRTIVNEIEKAFHRAARQVVNADGRRGEIEIAGRLDYESFLLKSGEPCIAMAEEAVRAVGLEPLRAVANGGVDANWLNAHGVPTVTLGCGQMHPHMTDEALDIEQFENACRIALLLSGVAA